MATMQYTTLGTTALKISRVGLGAMPLSTIGRPDKREDAIKVIHRTLDLGINLIDTSDAYCLDENEKHHNEKLIYEALQSYNGDTSNVVVATKGGMVRPNGEWHTDCNPNRLRKTIRESYEALGGKESIKLWQLHDFDDKYPLDQIFQPIREAVDQGLIKYVGVSNFKVDQIIEARKYVDIYSVQNQYSIVHRKPEQDGVLKYCDENKITLLAYRPVGGAPGHKNIVKQKLLVELGAKYNCSPYCIALAWLMSKSKWVVPIPGASHIQSIEDSSNVINIRLDQNDIQQIDLQNFK
ncbi:unnamed protein product [Didymodactylos carnosus]|uniref:NADP-dependent oxidoreductase domain-containing protein n=1 Tax=Didymodactylos carnosus TaxID=1234261 RepID=A0A813PUZ8_9BILA|nr:unnamed protein product [Didymodactylos carnosus]CAF1519432.1 unnamed protein product [Didymodactylos carnosus]CAF3539282.1 unnamed protein product [Didymodactylos carnosus]CAF4306460.1 unnamed protein product [Didymodactylos carnosus]